MPYSITVFLSSSLLFILIGCYILGYGLMGILFSLFHVRRRKDVIIRGGLMHGTFIFLSHILGAIVSGILLIVQFQLEMASLFDGYLITGLSMVASAMIYRVLSIYLWERLAIERRTARLMLLSSWFFAIPWYFLLN